MVRNIHFAILNMHNYMVGYILLFPFNMIFPCCPRPYQNRPVIHFLDWEPLYWSTGYDISHPAYLFLFSPNLLQYFPASSISQTFISWSSQFRNLKKLILLPLSYWSPLFVVRSPAYFPKESSCGVKAHSHKLDLTWHLLERAQIAECFFFFVYPASFLYSLFPSNLE